MFDLVELFCRIDDFWKNFEPLWKNYLLSEHKTPPKRTSSLSMSEVILILILFHFVRYRDFKTFYQNHLSVFLKKEFPGLVSYTQFLELKKRTIFPLYSFLFSLYETCSGISFVDLTSLTVCHPKRIYSHRVFRKMAKRGKTTKGWFYGFKLHIAVNEKGELLGFLLTSGQASDLAVIPSLVTGLFGKLFGDKGYISQQMTETLLRQGLQLITKLRASMKNKFISVVDKIFLRKRGMIDFVIRRLKYGSQIEHTRHRSPLSFIINLLGGLITYCLCPNKPSACLEKSVLHMVAM